MENSGATLRVRSLGVTYLAIDTNLDKQVLIKVKEIVN